MSAPKSTCYGCKRRKAGCHSVCADYIAYRREHEAYQKVIFEKKQKEALLYK
jgi:hypothetical protein